MIWRTKESRERLKQRCLDTPFCESCGRPPPRGIRLEWHHAVLRVGGAGSDFTMNGIAICRLCHSAAESSSQANNRILEIIARRHKTTIKNIELALWAIRRCPKGASESAITARIAELDPESARLALACLIEAGRLCAVPQEDHQ